MIEGLGCHKGCLRKSKSNLNPSVSWEKSPSRLAQSRPLTIVERNLFRINGGIQSTYSLERNLVCITAGLHIIYISSYEVFNTFPVSIWIQTSYLCGSRDWHEIQECLTSKPSFPFIHNLSMLQSIVKSQLMKDYINIPSHLTWPI